MYQSYLRFLAYYHDIYSDQTVKKSRFQYWTKSSSLENTRKTGLPCFLCTGIVDLSGIFANMNRPRIYWTSDNDVFQCTLFG